MTPENAQDCGCHTVKGVGLLMCPTHVEAAVEAERARALSLTAAILESNQREPLWRYIISLAAGVVGLWVWLNYMALP